MPFPKKSDGEPYPQLLHPPLSIRKHQSGVALGLERLVLRCLSRDPKSRPKLASLLPTLHQFIRGDRQCGVALSQITKKGSVERGGTGHTRES